MLLLRQAMLGNVTTPSTFLLAAGLQAAGLGSVFNTSLNATLFAPSDAALLAAATSLGFSDPQILLNQAASLAPVFQYHRKHA